MTNGARQENEMPSGRSFSLLAHLGVGYSLLDIGCSGLAAGRRIAVLVLLALALGGAAHAAPTNRTIITSDRLDFDYQHSIAVFKGNVVVVSPEVRIESDQLTVVMGADEDIESVTAVGNVRLTQGDRRARCRKAIYLAGKGELIMTGNAMLRRGRDTVKGNVIRIWVDQERMISEPGHLVLYPEE